MSEFREALVRVYPTTVRLPLWARPITLKQAIRSLRISDVSVRRISETFSLKGLMKSPYRPDIRPALHPEEVLPLIQSMAPIDGREVVEWMQISAAENVVMQARIAEYNALGSQMTGTSGDAYVPGVVVEDIKFQAIMGADVATQGYAPVVTPRGNFNVPNLGKSPGIFRDLISWGSISYNVGGIQFTGNLLKWKDLASTPIQQTVGFYMDKKGNTAPLFFVQQPTRPALTVVVKQTYTSNDKQTITINFRDPTDYTKVLGSKQVDVPAGTAEVSYTVSAFPYVPPVVAELQPKDNVQTKLESYTVT